MDYKGDKEHTASEQESLPQYAYSGVGDNGQAINVISEASTLESSAQDEQQYTEEPGTYSSFHDSGEPIMNPTSYILETDSDSAVSGQRVGSVIDEDGTDVAGDGGSSVYSSQGTVRLSSTATPLAQTPQRLINNKYHTLKSAPLPVTRRKLDANSAPLFNSHTAKSRGSYIGKDLDLDPPDSSYIHPSQTADETLSATVPLALHGEPNLSDQLVDPISEPNPQTHITNPGSTEWESALPALLYSNSFHDHKGLNHDPVARTEIQESLIRGNSIAGSQKDYLDVIKVSLSRNRSFKSSKLSTDSPPLLFSQDRKSLSRSMSTIRQGKNQAETLPKHEENELEEDSDNNEKDELSILGPRGKSRPPTAIATGGMTGATELNFLRSNDHDGDSRFYRSARGFPFVPLDDEPVKPSEQMEEPKNPIPDDEFKKMPHDEFKKPSNEKNPDVMTTKFIKVAGEKRYSIAIWILLMIIMILICIFVPLLILYSRGSDKVVRRYLANINPAHRGALLSEFSSEVSPAQSLPFNMSNPFENAQNTHIGASVSGVSLFENIPLKYQKNEEIREVMNNTALKNVFYGVNYAPRNVIYPICGATLHDVMLDVALLSQITSRLRTYGTQCNQARFILDSIKTLNLNMTLSMGVWIGPNNDINLQQMQDMKWLLKSYPRNLFESIYVGNEVLFREEQTPKALVRYINEVKDFVKEDLNWDLPVGTSELGPKINPDVMKVADILGTNAHPFFTGGNVQGATKWVFDFIRYQIEPLKERIKGGGPQIVVSEVGWPYLGGTYRKAVAGKRHMQYFLNNWICEAKQRNYPWFYFEAFDEPWKQVYHKENAKWETEWGVFTADRKLKDGISFPSC